MQLPSVTTPIVFWMTTKQSSVLLSGTKVQSIIEKHGNRPVQAIASHEPNWIRAGLTSQAINGLDTLGFAGSEYMHCAAVGSAVSQDDFTVFAVVKPTNLAGATSYMLSLGHSSGSGLVEIYFNSGDARLYAKNDAGTSSDGGGTVSNATHVLTLRKTGSTFILRSDGVQIATFTQAGTFTFNDFYIGAQYAAGSVSSPLHGNVTTVALYKGSVQQMASIESYLMVEAGLSSLIV